MNHPLKRSAILGLCGMIAVACLGLALAFDAKAHGSSHPQSGSDNGGSVMSTAAAPRARIWYDERLWQTGDGQVLVCEEHFVVEYPKKCYAKSDKKETDRWSTLQTKHADGFVLKFYEYRFVGTSGYKILIAYYGPPDVPAPVTPIEKVAATPAKVGIIQVDQLVIKADKVVVQRAKQVKK